MKTLELTEDHKYKLLEMCKVLFPEYKNIFLGDENGRYLKYQAPNSTNFIIFTGEMGGFVLIIHWFEFCIKHLSGRLFYKLSPATLQEQIRWFLHVVLFTEQYHPVDCLYKEFLKLK